MGDSKQDADLFNAIYEYYLSNYPDRRAFGSIKESLYTGVDQMRSSDQNTKSGIKQSFPEIYVRIDLVNADKMDKIPNAACNLVDNILSNGFKTLTDDFYIDGSKLSEYRALDPDSKFVDKVTGETDETLKAEADKAQEKGQSKPNLNPNPNEGRGGGRKSRSLRKYHKTRTLRAN
jgi:hypothetical protein